MKAVLKLPPAIRILRPAEARGCVPSVADAANGLWASPAPTEPATDDTMNSRRFMENSSAQYAMGGAGFIRLRIRLALADGRGADRTHDCSQGSDFSIGDRCREAADGSHRRHGD